MFDLVEWFVGFLRNLMLRLVMLCLGLDRCLQFDYRLWLEVRLC